MQKKVSLKKVWRVGNQNIYSRILHHQNDIDHKSIVYDSWIESETFINSISSFTNQYKFFPY